MRDLVYGIQDLFENFLFVPFNMLKEMELENWWTANTVNWLFTIVGFIATYYWLKQIKLFNDEGTERDDVTAHSIFED
ncbi:MAG: uracil phosphoribosyltransferase [Flavobacteriaceae bacterium]|nr:uracil phosphoribosyltransferase [Flavobacteriaceae bacterium]